MLPVQPDHPELCPYDAKPNLDPADGRSHSCVLLLLAPVDPAYLNSLYPQALLVNGGGIGGEFREKIGHRVALRLLLSSVPDALAPWIVIPTVYSDSLALAALSKLGGPRQLLLRHPHAVKFTANGGGEIAMCSEDLDEVLKVVLNPKLLDPEKAAEAFVGVSRRVATLVSEARFWPEGSAMTQGTALLLLEELISSQPLPQDGRKGWFDATHRAYCVHHRPTDEMPPCTADAAADEPPAAGAALAAEATVLSGCCRFPHQNLACGAAAAFAVHSQHSPCQPHAAVPLGPEMARGAFEQRLPLGPVVDALHAVTMEDLVSHCLGSPQHCLLHLTALSILGGTTAGARELIQDPVALNYSHFEYFGRPIAVAASLRPEHKSLLDDFVQPEYTQRYGSAMAKLVQKRVLYDVVVPDMACVACNALRAPDEWACGMLQRLRSSQHDEVRDAANQVYHAFHQMNASGMQTEHEEVADKKHMQQLIDMINDIHF